VSLSKWHSFHFHKIFILRKHSRVVKCAIGFVAPFPLPQNSINNNTHSVLKPHNELLGKRGSWVVVLTQPPKLSAVVEVVWYACRVAVRNICSHTVSLTHTCALSLACAIVDFPPTILQQNLFMYIRMHYEAKYSSERFLYVVKWVLTVDVLHCLQIYLETIFSPKARWP
jgi:hypothetical protein